MPLLSQRLAGRAEHALAFTDTAITLWRRAAGEGWRSVGGARLDAEDFAERVRTLPQRAGLRPGRALEVTLWLPPEHVVIEPAPSGAVAEVALALATRTGRDPAGLSVCLAGSEDAGRFAFAADQTTVDEAVAYARGWGFAPVAVSVPPDHAPEGAGVAMPSQALQTRRRPPMALAAGIAGVAVLGGVAAALWLAEPQREANLASDAVPAATVEAASLALAAPRAADPTLAVPAGPSAMSAPAMPGTATDPDTVDVRRASPAAPDRPAEIVAVSVPSWSEPGMRAGIVVASLGPIDLGLGDPAMWGLEPVAPLPVVPAPVTVPQRPSLDAPPVAAVEPDTPLEDIETTGTETAADLEEAVADLAPMPAILPPPRPGAEPAEVEVATLSADMLADTTDAGADGDVANVVEAQDESAGTEAEDVAIAAPPPTLRAQVPTARPDRPEPPVQLAAPRPGTRPARRPVAAAVAAAPAQPTAQVPANVAQAATIRGALPPGETGLLGVIGDGGTRTALLRTRDGRVQRVGRGDQVDGWTVSAIDATSVRLQGNGGSRTLRVPLAR